MHATVFTTSIFNINSMNILSYLQIVDTHSWYFCTSIAWSQGYKTWRLHLLPNLCSASINNMQGDSDFPTINLTKISLNNKYSIKILNCTKFDCYSTSDFVIMKKIYLVNFHRSILWLPRLPHSSKSTNNLIYHKYCTQCSILGNQRMDPWKTTGVSSLSTLIIKSSKSM